MQSNDSATQSTNQDDISITDIVNFFRHGWKTIGISGVIGLIISTGYAFLSPQKFQAEALIQGGVVAGQPIEPAVILIEKLKQPTYYSQNSLIQCAPNESGMNGQVLAREIKPTVVKNSSLISVTYKGYAAASAENCLNAVLLDIRRNQEQLPKPLIEAKKTQLQLAKQELDQTEKINSQLSKELNGNSSNSSALISSIILSNQSALLAAKKSIEAQEMELAPPQTQQASAATPIYAPDIPVSPKKGLVILVGILAGLAIGVVWLMARQTWQKIKLQL